MQTEIIDSSTEKHKDSPKNSPYEALKPSLKKKTSNYDPPIPRKLMSSICGTSINTLIKLEQEGLIEAKKVRRGGQDIVTYSVEDVRKVFNYKKINFKSKDSAEVISIFSQKGGVGKSAFTQHLSSMLSLVGRVLVVDLDAQTDATILLGLQPTYGDVLAEDSDLEPTIAELMDWSLADGSEPPYDMHEFSEIVKVISPSLHVLPSDLDLGEINYTLNRANLKDRFKEDGSPIPPQFVMIKEVLDKVKDQYDFIVIDCPPNIEACNVSALYASNRILIPLELEAKSLTTMRRNNLFLQQLSDVNLGFEWDKILIVPNKFRRENIKIKALAALEDRYGDSDFIRLSEVVVPNSSIIDKCSEWKKPIYSVTHRLSTTSNSSIPQAKEFTNYFWALMHELLDIDLTRLVFEVGDRKGG